MNFDRPLLGDITGLNVAHLQCHIGTDTLSLARLGATSVTGLDFSAPALEESRGLAKATEGSGGEKLTFVEASVYDSLKVLPAGTFDLVFTGIGALCWIHSIKDWAAVVAGLLRPGGRLFIREGHPILWTISDKERDELVIEYPYFEREEAMVFDQDTTYVDVGEKRLTATKTAEFNHGIGEIVQSLLDVGMTITGLVEHQSVPWDAIPGQMVLGDQDEYTLKDKPWRLPHSYTLQAVKK